MDNAAMKMPVMSHMLLRAVLAWGLVCLFGCAPAPKKTEAKAAQETIADVRQEKEHKDAAQPPSESVPKKGWTQQAKEDWGDMGHNLAEDIGGLWAGENILPNLVVLGGAGGLTAVSKNEWDNRIKRHFQTHNPLGDWDELGNVLGHPGTHWGIMGLFYAQAKIAQDAKSLQTSQRLAEALTLNDLTTLILKVSTDRERPDGKDYSFPSGHVSSFFATAAVLDGMYGPFVGVPLYLVGSFVAYSRLEAHNHYLSDVIFGAALGYVFGRTVTDVHKRKLLGFEVAPWVDPEGAGGVILQRRF